MIQQKVRNVLRRIAKRVEKNHLFEQQGERSVQPPIFHDEFLLSLRVIYL